MIESIHQHTYMLLWDHGILTFNYIRIFTKFYKIGLRILFHECALIIFRYALDEFSIET